MKRIVEAKVMPVARLFFHCKKISLTFIGASWGILTLNSRQRRPWTAQSLAFVAMYLRCITHTFGQLSVIRSTTDWFIARSGEITELVLGSLSVITSRIRSWACGACKYWFQLLQTCADRTIDDVLSDWVILHRVDRSRSV
jgi:hypothetical protein